MLRLKMVNAVCVKAPPKHSLRLFSPSMSFCVRVCTALPQLLLATKRQHFAVAFKVKLEDGVRHDKPTAGAPAAADDDDSG